MSLNAEDLAYLVEKYTKPGTTSASIAQHIDLLMAAREARATAVKALMNKGKSKGSVQKPSKNYKSFGESFGAKRNKTVVDS